MAKETDSAVAGASAQKTFVSAASNPSSACSKRGPRISKERLAASSNACPAQLSTEREVSTIPMAQTGEQQIPVHQEKQAPNWIYPSESQFYQAMQRKGWKPEAEDMSSVVRIHNAVNERVWREIRHWESALHQDCNCPRLKSFRGRPRDFSPKARFLNFLGYKLPFDRHDWIVDRCGQEIRYVIDFYNAAPLPHMPIAMHLDVRPALDTPSALWDRLKMQWSWMGSGRWRYE